MSGSYNAGERKIRPGNYYRYENNKIESNAPIIDGIGAAAFVADWGPLGQTVEIAAESEISQYYSGGNISLLSFILQGGASKVKAIRVGTGGTKAALTLQDTAQTPANVITLTAKYEGARSLSATIRDSLAVDTLRECVIYSGTTELTKVTFNKGTAEVDGLVAAIAENNDSVVTATKVAAGNGTLAAVAQSAFSAGTNPTITNTDYSNAFTVLEAVDWNVLCVDSNDTGIHALVKSYISRVQDTGKLVVGFVGEPITVAYSTRKANAAAFNDESIAYALNGWIDSNDATIDGWKAAAVEAGMFAAYPANNSLTHKPIPGAVSVAEALTNTQIEACLQGGALICTASSSGAVWIEQGINTLITPAANQDNGWKKLRRVKTRFELIARVLAATDPYIGSLSNDENGRATFIAMANSVGKAMISEGKLVSCNIYVDPNNPPQGDSAWFVFEVIDLDSIEFTYNLFKFQFSAA